jgi:hypothetical protein
MDKRMNFIKRCSAKRATYGTTLRSQFSCIILVIEVYYSSYKINNSDNNYLLTIKIDVYHYITNINYYLTIIN